MDGNTMYQLLNHPSSVPGFVHLPPYPPQKIIFQFIRFYIYGIYYHPPNIIIPRFISIIYTPHQGYLMRSPFEVIW